MVSEVVEMAARFKTPDELDIGTANKKKAWNEFKQYWANYEIATGLD